MSRHPFLTTGRHEVLAHRGASATKPPGNTWAAFDEAVEVLVDHIETDVQATADGRIVLFHDARLDDVTTGTGEIGDFTWSLLRSLRYTVDGEPTDQGLILLDDVLDRYPGTFFNIDVKKDAAVDETIRILRRHEARDRVCVAAFDWRRLRRLRDELGDGWCSAFSRAEIVAARGCAWARIPIPRFGDVVQVPREQKSVTVVDEQFVEACHDRDIAVHVWTVNDPDEMERLRELGVDALITDVPGRA